MANVLLTNLCNRKCPYCFAMQKVYGREGSVENPKIKTSLRNNDNRYMTINNLKKVIEFLKRSDVKLISLLGGEPTLHPKFIEIVETVLKADFEVKIFTNGLMSKKIANFLRETQERITIVVNLNKPDETSLSQWEQVNNVLSIIGDKAALSFNVYKANCDMDFLIDTILKHDLDKNIRVGIALPILGANNSYLPLEDYRKVGKMLADFTDRCAEHDIILGLDCGFTLCMFTPEEIGRMRLNNAQLNIFCKPIIDIGPNLDVWCCFPLSMVEIVRLEDFANRQQLVDYYDRKFSAYKHAGSLPNCIGCPQLRRQQCYGGCIVHTMRSFNQNTDNFQKYI